MIVVLVCLLIDGYNVLADPIGLSRLHPWHPQQRSYAPGLLVWQNRTNNPLAYQFVKVDVQPCLLLRAEVHQARLDADLVPQLQVVVIAWILHSTDTGLLGCQVSLTGLQATKKVASGFFPNRFAKSTLGERIVAAHHLFLAQALARVEQSSLGQPCRHITEGGFFRGLDAGSCRRC